MHYSEIIFFGCFIAFIVAILLVDLLVIDKEAHEVSMKEAGSWTAVWITLALAFSAFLWFHGDLVHGIHNMSDLQLVVSKYADHMKINPNDFESSVQMYRQHMTISYITGYLIEKTLSVDNLFVMMMIFTSFGVKKKDYQRVLNWGILGAIVMRFIFIFLGAAVIRKFDWVLIVFGGFLLYSGVKMFIDRNKDESHERHRNDLLYR
jgi:Membrane protein TerC, possibly involved in tellurium resistance